MTEITGIGSLPFTNPAEAVDYVFTAYSVPFFPQLPRHSVYASSRLPQMLLEVIPENDLTEILRGVRPGHGPRDFKDHVTSLPGFENFRQRLRNHGGRFYKLQLCGPLTASRIIARISGTALRPELLTQLTERFVGTAMALISETLAATSASCIFIWDEGIPLTEPSAANTSLLSTLLRAIENERVFSGVHCCAPFPLSNFLPYADNHWLAADLSGRNLGDDEQAILHAVLRTGGLIAGITDTSAETVIPAAAQAVFRKLAAAAADEDKFPLILAGGCGTGLKSDAFERQLCATLSAVARNPGLSS